VPLQFVIKKKKKLNLYISRQEVEFVINLLSRRSYISLSICYQEESFAVRSCLSSEKFYLGTFLLGESGRCVEQRNKVLHQTAGSRFWSSGSYQDLDSRHQLKPSIPGWLFGVPYFKSVHR